MMHRQRVAVALSLCSLACAASCSDRDEIWDASINRPPQTLGMRSAVAIIDPPANRAVLLSVTGDLELAPTALAIGQGFANAKVSHDGERLLVLSRGVVPRQKAEDEAPSLTLIDATQTPGVAQRYVLSDPLSGLAIDPASQFAVVFASERDSSFVQNPNELVVVDLERGPALDNPVELTLRSFGGRPQRINFTTELDLPGGPRRLLLVETERDVSLVDLANLDLPEITVQLSSGDDTLVPAEVIVHQGDDNRDDDTRMAIRVEGDPNLIIVDLVPAADAPQTFRAVPNVVHVGGAPSDIDFVQTDAGLRVAALVPARGLLTLADPNTGITTEVSLGAAFEQMSLVTRVVANDSADASDVALMWSSASANVAFVAMGSSVDTPYRSVERLELTEPVVALHSVPEPNDHLKILAAPGGGLVVLDLLQRTAAPITSSTSNTALLVSPDGARAWLSASGPNLAQLDLGSLHPRNLMLTRPIHSMFDVERRGGGRALLALHASGAIGATVLDAAAPSVESAREYYGLLLGDLP